MSGRTGRRFSVESIDGRPPLGRRASLPSVLQRTGSAQDIQERAQRSRRRSVVAGTSAIDLRAAHAENTAMEGMEGKGFLGLLLNAKKATQDIGETMANESLKQRVGSIRTQGENINHRSVRLVTQQDRAMKTIDSVNAGLAALSIFIMIVQVNSAWSDEEQEIQSNDWNTILKGVQSVFTVILLGGIIRYYALRVNFLHLSARLTKAHVWRTPAMFLGFILELLLISLHVPPFLEGSIDEKWSLVIFVRIYLIVRVIRDVTPFYEQRNELVKQGFRSLLLSRFDWRLAMRTWFYKRSSLVTIAFGLTVGVIGGFIIYVFEREIRPDEVDGATSGWMTAVAMSTVGYGKPIPELVYSRITIVAIAIIGVLVASLFVGVVGNDLSLPKSTEMAVSWYFRTQAYHSESEYSANLIQVWWRYYRPSSRLARQRRPFDDYQLHLKRLRRKFKIWTLARLRWELQASDPVLDQVFFLQDHLEVMNEDIAIDLEYLNSELFKKLEAYMTLLEHISDVLDYLEEHEGEEAEDAGGLMSGLASYVSRLWSS